MVNSYYIQRINKVIDYIEENLSKKMSLEELADVAMFSKYHFHRTFKIVAGETLNNYIKRLKMEKAYKMINLDKDAVIGDISFELGYNSTANFTRDFTEYYGISPKNIKNSDQRPIVRNLINNSSIKVDFKGIEYIPEKNVIYKRISKGYDHQTIPAVFGELYHFVNEQGIQEYIEQYVGIAYDDPDYTPPEKCRYDACMIHRNVMKLPKDMPFNIKKIAGGKYAIFYFEGKYEQYLTAWDVIFEEWLLNSEYSPDVRPNLEMYIQSDEYIEGYSRANLCLPVKLIKNE